MDTPAMVTQHSAYPSLDARSLIESEPIGRFQVVTYLLIFFTLALDGLDTQSMSYVGLSIAKEFGISMASLGSIFSSGLIGTAIGAFTFGMLGDLIGLKRIVVFVTVLVSCATIALGLAPTLTTVAVCRVLIGIGVGGALPNLIALASQYSPARRRATIVTLIGAGFPTGAALGGVLTAGVLAKHGWRAVFLVAGTVPLLLAPLLIFFLPESMPRLLRLPDAQREVAKLLGRLYPHRVIRGTICWDSQALAKAKTPLIALFMAGRAPLTLLLSAASFMSLLNVYLLSNWLPGLMQQAHSTSRESVLATTGYNVGGILGGIFLGRLMDRFGFLTILPPAYLFGAFCLAVLAFNHFDFLGLAAITFVAGMFTVGNQGSLNALPALFFPDTMRATGTGWVSSIGRVGSILGPLLVGVLLTWHWTHAQILFAAVIPACLTAVALFLIYSLGLAGNWKTS